MIIYIAGPMAGLPDRNAEAFYEAEERLTEQGHIVLNPAWLPEGLPERDYLPIDIAMLRAADAIYLLPGWERSFGAKAEQAFAIRQGMVVIQE